MNIEIFVILFIAAPAAVGQTWFVYRYARYSAWKTTRIGKTLMVKSAALAILLDVTFLKELVYYKAPQFVSIAGILEILAYLGIVVAVWIQLFVIIHSQNRRGRVKIWNKDQDVL